VRVEEPLYDDDDGSRAGLSACVNVCTTSCRRE